MPWSRRLGLIGGGGEPVDFVRTLRSHGVADLPPMFATEVPARLETTLRVSGGAARVAIEADGRRSLVVKPFSLTEVGLPSREEKGFGATGRLGPTTQEAIVAAVRHILRLDEDLARFYEICAGDPELSWACRGAGRMLRSQTVFEDVVKTICTTNCSWAATERMVGGLVEHLGEAAPGAPPSGVRGRAFPTAEAMAGAGEDFYRGVVRAGYRGPYMLALARSVAAGEVDLETLGTASAEELSDDEVEARLLGLPGVGPYAAAHVMMMLGRYSRLILDSWTRPTYMRLAGFKRAKDSTITRRWRRFGDYAGLAFWLYLTRGWVEDGREGS
jgi:3-methyladenine DNA glycosylase/8-oxoguanine DNA glycosylase